MVNSKYYNYSKTPRSTSSRLPINTHLVFEIDYGNNPGRLIIVDSIDRTKVYYSADYGVTWTQMDVDPSNSSGDQKSRDLDIQAAWHDADNEIIWFVDCDNDDSDTYFDVWTLDYSTWGSFSITEVGSSAASTSVYAFDIFKIGSDIFVNCQEVNIYNVYDVDAAPFTLKDSLYLWLYGFYGGGYDVAYSDDIEYIDTTTTSGNSADKGDLTVARGRLGGVASTIYGFFCGGYTGSRVDIIDYINMLTTSGNASDKGDLTVAREYLAGVDGITYGFLGGGYGAGYQDEIDYINLTTTTGDATDRGDLTVARTYISGVSGPTYGFYGGGYTGSGSNVIDYIDITTTSGNATDRGDLVTTRYYICGMSGPTYGFYGGGVETVRTNRIEYIDMTVTSGNASDKGDLTVARGRAGATSGQTYGFYAGGDSGAADDTIDYIDLTTTTGNAIDRGDLLEGRYTHTGVSNNNW